MGIREGFDYGDEQSIYPEVCGPVRLVAPPASARLPPRHLGIGVKGLSNLDPTPHGGLRMGQPRPHPPYRRGPGTHPVGSRLLNPLTPMPHIIRNMKDK